MALKKQHFAEGEIAIFDEACIYKRGEYWQFRMWREQPILALDEQGTVVSGTADLIVETAEGLWVIDHKSDQTDNPIQAFTGYRPQLGSYATALAGEGKTVLGIAILDP